MIKINVAQWRDDRQGAMQVVSGPVGKRKIHFEAPPASMVEKEMDAFFSWINKNSRIDGIIQAGVAHLWFITIHPFDDGNGRIARTVTDMLLARDEKNPKRFYSLSSQIMTERNDYYDILNATQRGNLDITLWLEWFLGCINRAILNSSFLLKKIMVKGRFWQVFAQTKLNERQTKVINRLLDAGPGGFEGGLKNKTYMVMAHTSRATAQREMADLMQKGILMKLPGGGRSTSYEIDWEKYGISSGVDS